MGDLREVRRLVAEVEAPSPEPEPLYPLASSVDASSASAAAAALFPSCKVVLLAIQYCLCFRSSAILDLFCVRITCECPFLK